MQYRKIAALAAVGVLSSGCVRPIWLAEPTPTTGISNEVENYPMTAEQLKAVPIILKETETTTEKFDETGKIVTERTVAKSSVTRGVPPAVRTSRFQASETFADTELGLHASTNNNGTLVDANRNTTVDAESHANASIAYIESTKAAADLQREFLGDVMATIRAVSGDRTAVKTTESNNETAVAIEQIRNPPPAEEHVEPAPVEGAPAQ